MRKLFLFALLAVAPAAHALVTSTIFFPAPAPLIEDFESIPAASYSTVPVFSVPAVAYSIPAFGQIDVGPPAIPNPAAFSGVQTMLGVNTDIGIKTAIPMRRFGGYFRNNINSAGITASFARILFYDSAGNFLGSSTPITLTPLWTWYGYITGPQKWSRVEIYGFTPGTILRGGVEMDDLRMRPN